MYVHSRVLVIQFGSSWSGESVKQTCSPYTGWRVTYKLESWGWKYNMQSNMLPIILAFPLIIELIEILKCYFYFNFRIVHDYVIWRLVMDLMPHMPPQYEATRAEFRARLIGRVDRSQPVEPMRGVDQQEVGHGRGRPLHQGQLQPRQQSKI
jgi:hypothetical protein